MSDYSLPPPTWMYMRWFQFLFLTSSIVFIWVSLSLLLSSRYFALRWTRSSLKHAKVICFFFPFFLTFLSTLRIVLKSEQKPSIRCDPRRTPINMWTISRNCFLFKSLPSHRCFTKTPRDSGRQKKPLTIQSPSSAITTNSHQIVFALVLAVWGCFSTNRFLRHFAKSLTCENSVFDYLRSAHFFIREGGIGACSCLF